MIRNNDEKAFPASIGDIHILDTYIRQLKTWATTITADLEPLSWPRVFDHAQWRKDWVKVSSELSQDGQAWGAFILYSRLRNDNEMPNISL